MGIATVRGAFRTFEGTIDATGDAPVLNGTVEVSSIDTGDEHRDAHLKAPDFFDVEQYPQIAFHTTAIEAADDGKIRLDGRDHDQGHHQADRADRHRCRRRHRPVGQRASRLRGRGRDRPPRLRAQVEPDPPRTATCSSPTRSSSRQRVGRQGGVTQMKILAISGSLRAASHNTALLRAAAELAPEGSRSSSTRGSSCSRPTTRTATPTSRRPRSCGCATRSPPRTPSCSPRRSSTARCPAR